MIPPTDGEGNLDVVDNTWTRTMEDHLIKSGGNTPYEDKGDDYTAEDDPAVGSQTGEDYIDELVTETEAAKEGTGTPVDATPNNFTTTTSGGSDNQSNGGATESGGLNVSVQKGGALSSPLLLGGAAVLSAFLLAGRA